VSYDPFARGHFPVGVRSLDLVDPERERRIPLELWYPAAEEARGRDLSPESQDRYRVMPATPEVGQEAVRDAAAQPGRFPLILFSHGFGGHRRQTTHFCTHLASHGYWVAAPDHTGNTMIDMMGLVARLQSGGEAPDPMELVGSFVADRPLDVSFAIDQLLEDAGAEDVSLDPERIGMSGHSFGGWTTLQVSGRDPRVRAALPLAPAGGPTPLAGETNPLESSLELDWERDVPTLFLVAERDTLLPLEGMHSLYGRTRGPKRMVVLQNSDHLHFCDRVEETHELFRMLGGMALGALAKHVPAGAPDLAAIASGLAPMAELCPGEHAYALLRGLGLAHMDAHLREQEEARALLEEDLQALLAELGVAVKVL
jgi:dienelactone hydrolase